MRFDYTISHVPGKLLYTADTLFRAPAGTSDPDCKALQEDVELYIECVTHHLPATERKLLEYQRHQAEDPVCAQVMKYCSFGWPDKHSIDTKLKPFWGHRGVLTVHKGLLLVITYWFLRLVKKKFLAGFTAGIWGSKDAS